MTDKNILFSCHSTALEGSTLTEKDCQKLILYGLTTKNKAFTDHLMVTDHHNALNYILTQAKQKTAITPEFVKQINARVMSNTGSVTNTALGSFDSSQGDYRLLNVAAGGHYFASYDKVPALTKNLCEILNEQINQPDMYKLAFMAHYELVAIHPYADGNGRTARLLMNYILAYHDKPLVIVQKKDRAAYIESLNESRKIESLEPFYSFMSETFKKS